MKKSILIIVGIISFSSVSLLSQGKNFIDQPYIEVETKIDTLINPDEIYINIIIAEKDTRGKISTEELERKMLTSLQQLNIPIEEDLTVQDIGSNFQKYLFRKKDIQKIKSFSLKVQDAKMASKVIVSLESIGISNVHIEKLDFSDRENLTLDLYTAAVLKAKKKAEIITKALDQKLGKAIYISDINEQIYQGLSGQVAGIRIRGISSIYGSSATKPEIEFKKILISCDVQIKFAIE